MQLCWRVAWGDSMSKEHQAYLDRLKRDVQQQRDKQEDDSANWKNWTSQTLLDTF